jgi:hypothetical protein
MQTAESPQLFGLTQNSYEKIIGMNGDYSYKYMKSEGTREAPLLAEKVTQSI